MDWFWFGANAVPAVGLYLWFKLREKNLLNNWNAMFRDGVASAVAALWLGATIIFIFDGWVDYIGWGLGVLSLTYGASAVLAWRNLQAIQAGKPVTAPFAPKTVTTPPKAQPPTLNRQQRRRQQRQK